jgi:hypothetical protein
VLVADLEDDRAKQGLLALHPAAGLTASSVPAVLAAKQENATSRLGLTRHTRPRTQAVRRRFSRRHSASGNPLICLHHLSHAGTLVLSHAGTLVHPDLRARTLFPHDYGG